MKIFDHVTVCKELEESGHFEWMDMSTDEDEHSIEMHLPFIAKVMERFAQKNTFKSKRHFPIYEIHGNQKSIQI